MAWLPSARAQRDEVLRPEIHRVHQASLDGCYGAKKIWKQLQREGITVANCTVRRLMKDEGIAGVGRGRHLHQDPHRVDLRGLRHRCLLESDCWLAGVNVAAQRLSH